MNAGNHFGNGDRHQLKPTPATQNPFKRVTILTNAFQRVSGIRRRIHSAAWPRRGDLINLLTTTNELQPELTRFNAFWISDAEFIRRLWGFARCLRWAGASRHLPAAGVGLQLPYGRRKINRNKEGNHATYRSL
jgi:hypothetical protein